MKWTYKKAGQYIKDQEQGLTGNEYKFTAECTNEETVRQFMLKHHELSLMLCMVVNRSDTKLIKLEGGVLCERGYHAPSYRIEIWLKERDAEVFKLLNECEPATHPD